MTTKSETPWWRNESVVETVKTIGIVVGIVVFVQTLLFQPFRIPSSSMEGTLEVGDYLFVSKYSYGYSIYSIPLISPAHASEDRILGGPVDRGDVVVFRLPSDPSQDYIKRVVGLPGDRIQVIAGVLHINGVPVKLERIEDRIDTLDDGTEINVQRFMETLPNGVKHVVLNRDDESRFDNTEEFVVPAGHYFMMGDNRDNSNDSRGDVGFVPAANLVGRAQVVFFSHDGSAALGEFWKWPFSIRDSRLLNLIS
ncbi:MAG TPA: signal peptidase I [Nitrospira sp.]|nr:signal peptidase I [Nitrospira sp.]